MPARRHTPLLLTPSVAALAVAASCLLAAALMAVPLKDDRDRDTTAAQLVAARGPGAPAAAPVPARPRALLLGDSLLYQAAPRVEERLGAAGVDVSDRAVPGSGLLSAPLDFVQHWLDDASRLVDDVRPDVVVVQFVGNYGPPYAHDAGGRDIRPHSAAFLDAWTAAAEDLLARVRVHGARVVWVLSPPLRSVFDGRMGATVDAVTERYRDLAARHPDVVVVDWAAALGGRPYVGEVDGVVVRRADGVHLTEAGVARVADVTAAAVLRVLGLPS